MAEPMTEDQIATIRGDIRNLGNTMEARFAHVEERFEKIDDRFARIDERFASMDAQFARVEVELSTKPSKADVWQTMFFVNSGLIAVIGITTLLVTTFVQ